ncbi:hypothetical protein Taro_036952 [Colocasia esculenta]|uniref:Uncharacterized protein n=1 Tax=Colocasia esculenta TaxID=4460 RepID=A0A843WBB7_COLES|nr:hypothetical protein [Colocasia esculenta]
MFVPRCVPAAATTKPAARPQAPARVYTLARDDADNVTTVRTFCREEVDSHNLVVKFLGQRQSIVPLTPVGVQTLDIKFICFFQNKVLFHPRRRRIISGPLLPLSLTAASKKPKNQRLYTSRELCFSRGLLPTSFKPPRPHHLRPLWLLPPSVTAASEKRKNQRLYTSREVYAEALVFALLSGVGAFVLFLAWTPPDLLHQPPTTYHLLPLWLPPSITAAPEVYVEALQRINGRCGLALGGQKTSLVVEFILKVTSKKDQQQYWCLSDCQYQYVSVVKFAEAFRHCWVGKKLSEELGVPFDRRERPFGLIAILRLYPVTNAREALQLEPEGSL